MNDQELIRQAMRLLGSRKSERKAAAVRENGKKGGRPRKSEPSARVIAPDPMPAVREPPPKRDSGMCLHGRERKFCVFCGISEKKA